MTLGVSPVQVASWFETRAAKFTQAAYTCLRAALLTTRILDLILRSAHLRASRRMKATGRSGK
jgi:hypothetical protein